MDMNFNSISHEWAQRTSEISSWPLEDKIHIHAWTCNILYILEGLMGLTARRKQAKHLAVRRKHWENLTVSSEEMLTVKNIRHNNNTFSIPVWSVRHEMFYSNQNKF